jgi:hypothetical protein
MVAEHRNHLLAGVFRVTLLDPNLPDPMNVPAFVSMKSHVVLLPAGLHTGCALRLALVEINHHSPFMP